ncbi:hypothetical protein ACSBR1_040543 [Camellia fascicularis]
MSTFSQSSLSISEPPLLSSPFLFFPLTLPRTDPHNLSLSLSRYPYNLSVAAAAATSSQFSLRHPNLKFI